MLGFYRFHALLEITRFSSTTTRLLNDSSPLFRESPTAPVNNNSSSLPSRRPANRTAGQGQEVNSNPVHRRGGNIRRLRITGDGQVQVSDDDSSGEPASNVRVVDAQESIRAAGSSRSLAGRHRARFLHRLSPNSSHWARASPTESQTSGNEGLSNGKLRERKIVAMLSRDAFYTIFFLFFFFFSVSQRVASARSYLRNAEQRYQRIRNTVMSSTPDEANTLQVPSQSHPSSSSIVSASSLSRPHSSQSPSQRSSQQSLHVSSQRSVPSSSLSSPSTSQSSSHTSPQSSSQSSSQSISGHSSQAVPNEAPTAAASNSSQAAHPSASQSAPQSDSQDAARLRPQPSSPNEIANAARLRPQPSSPNETANAAAAVGAARQVRGAQGNIPLSQDMELHVASADVWEALVVIREARAQRQQARNPGTARDRRDVISRFLRRLQDLNESQQTLVSTVP